MCLYVIVYMLPFRTGKRKSHSLHLLGAHPSAHFGTHILKLELTPIDVGNSVGKGIL